MIIDRTSAPEIHTIDKIELPSPNHYTLDNGIVVHGFNLGSQDVVQIEFVIKAGQKHAKTPLIASATANMIGEASSKFNPGEIIKHIDYYGAFFESSCDGDKSYFGLYTLTKHLPKVLPVFADAILNPVFPERETQIYLKNSKQNFLTNLEKTSYLSRRYFYHHLFKNHPYGYVLKHEDYDAITTSNLIEFHNKYLVSENCEIFVAGKYDKSIYTLLNESFSPIVKKEKNTPFFKKLKENKGEKHFVSKSNALQSGIRIGRLLDIEYGSADFFNLKILNTVFGGYFGSRLMSNIREDKGYTYGIGSGIAIFEDADFFYITTEVGKDVTQAAINEIYNELNIITDTKISDVELYTVKNYMLGKLLKESDGVFSIADLYKGVYFKGKNLDFYNKYIEAINNVTPNDLLDVAQKYLDRKDILEVVAGDNK